MPYKDRDERREYARNWRTQRRTAFLSDKQCARCASTDRLEVHHKDRAEKIAHNVWSWTARRREAELAKCEVLCHDCHLKTHETPHGSERRFKKGCRCAECCAFNDQVNEWRRQKKRDAELVGHPDAIDINSVERLIPARDLATELGIPVVRAKLLKGSGCPYYNIEGHIRFRLSEVEDWRRRQQVRAVA